MSKPRRHDGQLRFGLMWPNTQSHNVTSRVVADANPDILDVANHLELARTVEETGLDYVFFADSYTVNSPASAAAGHGEPRIFAPIWAAAVIGATKHIGVVTTLHTRYLSPVLIARIGANLDVLSGGRWGWNIVPGSKAAESALFGFDNLEHDRRYEYGAETLTAVKALWRAGREPIEFTGEHVRLSGALCGPTPVQRPNPVIFNPGVSPAGLDLIASECDFGFSAVVDDWSKVRSAVDRVTAKAAEFGRAPSSVGLVGSIGVVIGQSMADAEERLEWFRSVVDIEAARGFANFFLANSKTYRGLFEGQDYEQLVRRIGVGAGSTVLCGTAEEVAEQFVELNKATGMSNFLLLPMTFDSAEIAGYGRMLPHLQRAGVWTPPSQRGWSW
ncbi:LLM class flavin-dependent oxidoreductase [Micromonospora sp. MA102]|uniref:LLM class flavin-dependent oxidoreductase n=1 Tax=Micromonospora sp. MA102 TaxID=2952755 RepID=UPI0021C8E2FA|nr:LLM class flavin-dependent oxidoreductase [Micromonospora sp. MA102]